MKWRLRLPAGIYYWSVQAIDASYAGSEFSTPMMFDLSESTGVDDINLSEELKYYPNPTAGLLYMQIPGMDSKTFLTVRNILGAIVLEKSIEISADRKVKIDISNLPPGMYLMHIEGASYKESFKVSRN